MNKNDDIPYVLLANGCRYFPEEAEQDRREGRQQQPNTCAACYQPLLFILAFFKLYNGIERRVSSHFKHRPGDLEACAGYAQLRRFTSCLNALVKNARNANVNFVLECESADCVEDVPPPYVIAFREVNDIYQDAFNDAFDDTFNDTYGGASDTAIKNKTFRIKAKTNCSLFNHSRCQRCDTRHIEKLAGQLAEQEETNKREEQEAAQRNAREEQLRKQKAEEAAERNAREEQLRAVQAEQEVAARIAQEEQLMALKAEKEVAARIAQEEQLMALKAEQEAAERIAQEEQLRAHEAKLIMEDVNRQFLQQSMLKKAADKAKAADDKKKTALLIDERAAMNSAAKQLVEAQRLAKEKEAADNKKRKRDNCQIDKSNAAERVLLQARGGPPQNYPQVQREFDENEVRDSIAVRVAYAQRIHAIALHK
jgi:hypothetical protein